ncbi:hypothetical protein ACFVAG_32695 [Streptomyces sp. NPDC057644]|uniref:hypothetical protein n=1 Tax=Streptomyces sp. NPDC057644 TaxID=3346191 RepID=UPI0036CA419C
MPVLSVGTAHSDATDARALHPYADDTREVLAPTGHFVAEEDPAWFAATLDEFLTSARR